MMLVNREAPGWGRAPRNPEPPKNVSVAPIDLDRLVWDQEYRDEVRLSLNMPGPEA